MSLKTLFESAGFSRLPVSALASRPTIKSPGPNAHNPHPHALAAPSYDWNAPKAEKQPCSRSPPPSSSSAPAESVLQSPRGPPPDQPDSTATSHTSASSIPPRSPRSPESHTLPARPPTPASEHSA